MMGLYGKQFENSYGHVSGRVYQQWHEALSAFTLQQIKTGLDELVAEGSDYAPNLIKFCRLCRTTAPAYHKTAAPALPAGRPHRSIMRIETAKQKVLTGQSFGYSADGTRYIEDWTDDDETALQALIKQFEVILDESGRDTLTRLNSHIGGHKFSAYKTL